MPLPAPPIPAAGFIGLGAMGGPMARNLLAAGCSLLAFDTHAGRLGACAAAGAAPAPSAAEVMLHREYILTSLPSSGAFVRVAEESLLPHARPGQVVIDLGTTTPPEARRLSDLFAACGARLVEAPVSGGPGGAARQDLLMFVGGDPQAAERCRPLLEALTQPGRITYCGLAGAGQVVKGVNQLAMALVNAAYLEALAFGVRAGVDLAVLRAAVSPAEGFPGDWRAPLGAAADRIAGGRGEEIGVKFRELPYFLQEARASGFSLPLTEVLHAFCDAGERVAVDDNRPAPSFWRQLNAWEGRSGGD